MEIAADKVGEVIHLAREMAQDFPGAEAQLDGLLEGMDEDEVADLVALLWVGRGDFEPEEWDDARQAAVEEADTPLADYLKRTDHLPDHLQAGLDIMGADVTDAEDSATIPGPASQ